MSSRNIKSRTANRILNQIILHSVVMLALVGGLGLITVWLRHQTSITANHLQSIEQKIVEERRVHAQLDVELAVAMSTDKLLELNREHGLNLQEPAFTKIVHVEENVEKRLYEKSANALFTASALSGN